jgi:ABC-2 type transport system permease protein
MNSVVINLTRRALLGKRRALLLMLLPGLLLGIAALVGAGNSADAESASGFIQGFGLGTLLPLICLLIGTGVIGPEIEDQSLIYLLAKPVKRSTIVLSKLAVAYGAALVFAVIPTVAATWLAGGREADVVLALAVTAALASLTYVTVFFLLATLTRNAVVVGLLYAVLWETVLGGYAPGVRALSVRQWSLAPAEQIAGAQAQAWGIASEVSLTTGVIAIAITTVAAIALASRRLSRLQLSSGE